MNFVLLWVAMAIGQEAETPPSTESSDTPQQSEAEVLLPEPEALPSALDDPTPVLLSSEDLALADALVAWQAQERVGWSAGNFVRPALSLLVTEDVHPVQLGVQVGRRWWQLEDGLAAAFEVQGTADFALAEGTGSYDLGLSILGGPWARYVGLQLGPGLGASAWTLGSQTLDPAVGLDVWTVAVVDLKHVHLFAGAVPRWLLSGDRAPASVMPLPLGDELALQAGVGFTLGTLRLGADLTRRYTALGPLDRYRINLRFRMF